MGRPNVKGRFSPCHLGRGPSFKSQKSQLGVQAMKDKNHCRQCGYVIVIGGRYPDQRAQEKGFCGAGCEEVYEKIKEIEKERAA